jgi:hypothetical protein
MAQQKNWFLALCCVLAGVLFLTAIPTAWATPDESPLQQTVPTPTKEKKDKLPPAPPPPLEPGVPIKVPLGPGSAPVNLPLPNGCYIQINVEGLTANYIFEITPVSPGSLPPPPDGYQTASVAFTLKIWDVQTGQEVQTISPPFIVTIGYCGPDLGADPNDFVLAYYDETQHAWVILTGTIVDAANRHIYGSTNHASFWALFVRKPGVAPAAAGPTPALLPVTGGESGPNVLLIAALLAVLLLGVGSWLAQRAWR